MNQAVPIEWTSRVLAAFKWTTIVGFGVPWELSASETDLLKGLSHDQIAEIVAQELAGGPLISREAQGVASFITRVLDQKLLVHDRDVWANVLGQSRQKTLQLERLAASSAERADSLGRDNVKQAEALAEARRLLEECSAFLQPNEGAVALVRQLERALDSRA